MVVVLPLRSAERREAELELRSTIPPRPEDGKAGSEGRGCGWGGARRGGSTRKGTDGFASVFGGAEGELPVCVTSAASYIGRAIVGCLLSRGYSVRLAVETRDDLEKLGEAEVLEGRGGGRISAVAADVMDVEGLCEAFDGCAGVFHTSAFLDPAGISGYSKHMAEMEATAAAKVVEACARTPSVRRCVFTSSLLACVWRRHHPDPDPDPDPHGQRRAPALLDESCWSDETLCRDKKLWLALGKTMAERAAWRAARGRDVKVATLCPALLTGPAFCSENPSSSVAYLKGGDEMYAEGLLATVDVGKVAEAHVCVYEAMDGGDTSCGRYICFDRVVHREEDITHLGRQLGLANWLSDGTTGNGGAICFVLSNSKLRRLMSRRRCPTTA